MPKRLPGFVFHALFDASRNPYPVLDRDLNLASANRAYRESTSLTLDGIAAPGQGMPFPPPRRRDCTVCNRIGEVDRRRLSLSEVNLMTDERLPADMPCCMNVHRVGRIECSV